jgi:hypothetical protein
MRRSLEGAHANTGTRNGQSVCKKYWTLLVNREIQITTVRHYCMPCKEAKIKR